MFLDCCSLHLTLHLYSGTLVPLLQFWSFPSTMFKITLTGMVWYVLKINKVLTNIVTIRK